MADRMKDRPAARVVRFGGGWEGRELEKCQLDYPDELKPPPVLGTSGVDAVSRAVVSRGGAAVFIEGHRPAWALEPARYPGEPVERTRFSRFYPSLNLLVDVRAEASAVYAEQKRRKALCLENGAAYCAVDMDGWSEAGVGEAIGIALEEREGKAREARG